ncbi:MAG: hypothetical protein RR255_00215 [Bacilli bacterium]
MTSSEIKSFIQVRKGELCSDEILSIIDIKKNPQINHIIYENNKYTMWDYEGNEFNFMFRNW